MRVAYMIGALVGRSMAQENNLTLPSADGKFFYADLKSDENYNNHVDLMVGSLNDTIKLQITVDEIRAGVITDKCSKTYCNVPHRFELTKSKTLKDFDRNSKETSEAVHLLKKDTRSIIRTRYTGDIHIDKFVF